MKEASQQDGSVGKTLCHLTLMTWLIPSAQNSDMLAPFCDPVTPTSRWVVELISAEAWKLTQPVHINNEICLNMLEEST